VVVPLNCRVVALVMIITAYVCETFVTFRFILLLCYILLQVLYKYSVSYDFYCFYSSDGQFKIAIACLELPLAV